MQVAEDAATTRDEVLGRGLVVVGVQADAVERSERPLDHESPRLGEAGVEASLERDLQQVAAGVERVTCLAQRQRDRLLAEHRQLARGAGSDLCRVVGGRRRDHDRVRARLQDGLDCACANASHEYLLDVRVGAQPVRPIGADAAGAEDRDFHTSSSRTTQPSSADRIAASAAASACRPSRPVTVTGAPSSASANASSSRTNAGA